MHALSLVTSPWVIMGLPLAGCAHVTLPSQQLADPPLRLYRIAPLDTNKILLSLEKGPLIKWNKKYISYLINACLLYTCGRKKLTRQNLDSRIIHSWYSWPVTCHKFNIFMIFFFTKSLLYRFLRKRTSLIIIPR